MPPFNPKREVEVPDSRPSPLTALAVSALGLPEGIDHAVLAAENEKRTANDTPRGYQLQQLPQLEAELAMLKDRLQLATNRASEYQNAVIELEKKIPIAKKARQRLVNVTTNRAIPGASQKVAELDREIEIATERLRSCARERDRQQDIADATRRLIEDWPPMEAVKGLREVQAALNAVDSRLTAPSF